MESYGVTTTPSAPDNLLAGAFPLVTDGGVIASGEGVLTRGTVLGVITASGKYAAYDDAAVDGSEEPAAILAVDVDATSADVLASVYLTGEFRADALTGYDAAIKAALRALSIFVKE
jgi:hypothetical protein